MTCSRASRLRSAPDCRRSSSMRVVQRDVKRYQVLDMSSAFAALGVIVRFIEYWMSVTATLESRAHRAIAAAAGTHRFTLAAEPRSSRPIAARSRAATRSTTAAVSWDSSHRSPTVLRRLLARAPVLGRQVLHLPVRSRRHRPARAIARRRQRRGITGADSRGLERRSDRYSELRDNLRARGVRMSK